MEKRKPKAVLSQEGLDRRKGIIEMMRQALSFALGRASDEVVIITAAGGLTVMSLTATISALSEQGCSWMTAAALGTATLALAVIAGGRFLRRNSLRMLKFSKVGRTRPDRTGNSDGKSPEKISNNKENGAAAAEQELLQGKVRRDYKQGVGLEHNGTIILRSVQIFSMATGFVISLGMLIAAFTAIYHAPGSVNAATADAHMALALAGMSGAIQFLLAQAGFRLLGWLPRHGGSGPVETVARENCETVEMVQSGTMVEIVVSPELNEDTRDLKESDPRTQGRKSIEASVADPYQSVLVRYIPAGEKN